ncbi:MAG: LacI family DNA-binding transcriptional regulator [Actinomycetes bacterium]
MSHATGVVGEEGVKIPSLRDVARAAGVSVSTASRVLSGSSHPVSEPTRRRVLEAAERLGFEPNRLARALATARSRTIGVVVHDVSDPYYAEIVRGLEDAAGSRDHALFVSSSDRDVDKELAVLRAFVANQVDAIVLVASAIDDPRYLAEASAILDRFRALGGVVMTMSEHGYAAPRLGYENRAGTRLVVTHLLDLGHRRIGYIAGPPDLLVTRVRQRGYEEAMTELGLGVDPELVVTGDFTIEGGARAAERLLRAEPTAIVAANDMMAIGAIRHLLDVGKRVPGDVSVAGFDDIEFAAYAAVPLTTVHVPLGELGQLGGRLVLDLLDGNPPEEWPRIDARLVVRESTAAPPT